MALHRLMYWIGILSIIYQTGYWISGFCRRVDRMRGALAHDIAVALAPGWAPGSTLDTAFIFCGLEIAVAAKIEDGLSVDTVAIGANPPLP